MSINPETYEKPSIPPELYEEARSILEAVAAECVCVGPDENWTCLAMLRDCKPITPCAKCRAEKFLSEHP